MSIIKTGAQIVTGDKIVVTEGSIFTVEDIDRGDGHILLFSVVESSVFLGVGVEQEVEVIS